FCSFSLFTCTTTSDIYTLSLHDALPISDFHGRQARLGMGGRPAHRLGHRQLVPRVFRHRQPTSRERNAARRPGGISSIWLPPVEDRKSTRLNSSHVKISYAVFCLKKKKK